MENKNNEKPLHTIRAHKTMLMLYSSTIGGSVVPTCGGDVTNPICFKSSCCKQTQLTQDAGNDDQHNLHTKIHNNTLNFRIPMQKYMSCMYNIYVIQHTYNVCIMQHPNSGRSDILAGKPGLIGNLLVGNGWLRL